jgi:nucleotide-binding universal stress UspA family protein
MKQLKKILYPTDFSRCANQAFWRAMYLARKYQSELHMLRAIVLHDDDPYNAASHYRDIEALHNKLKEMGSKEMSALVKSYHAEDINITKVNQRGLVPASVILEYALENDIDLIVMGTHGRRGLGHLFLGSAAEEVVRLAKCSVLTIREMKDSAPAEALNNILVPIDFSDFAQLSLNYAKEIATAYNARLQLLHVVEQAVHPSFYASGMVSIVDLIPDIEKKSIEAMERLVQKTKGLEINADFHVIEGHAAKDIIKFAESHNSDLIVIATHGLTGIKHLLLGSVAEKVVRMAPCPVFTVKPFGKSLL